ncbi:two-component system, chemotaxis family, CheB/CheR fusion protein [Desulfonatronum thiosulfatophilum]|uniref:protein-glutamate O-methyltransferase n=1 Tax=Desulfonatronum thiosulfatophilum TaxID=617002 RepID=A0A1G6EPA0_9BACT|nr:chemotaxis protein CheB [Desulfonatronum thiosulfatophilum]SDB59339.1 two-component system, chemotaxis family, CheB/CheR fusion protein [Desulfonatronum thiosulfatophilum]
MSPSKKNKAKPIKSASQELAASSSAEAPQPAADPAAGFPIVGIGASAGGLAAFEAFFSGMPEDTDPNMAFVLVQHLAPDHKSMLTELIRRYTRMKVFEVEDGMQVRPNCIYIIPPNRDMAFLNSTLQLLEPNAPRGHRLPIDFFFRSLAQDQRERAIGIVLSGTGSDGTLGVRDIKGEGGMAMAQNPASTEYDGMPRSALATGLVDFELPPAEMPAQLIAYVTHAFGRPPKRRAAPSTKSENELKKIFVLLRNQTGHDFSQYKPSTVLRRIERRMAVHQIETISGYVRFMQQTPEEVKSLFRDLLIGVTSFFRDPEAFKALEKQVVPKLFADKPANAVIRVWSVGCSSGEEAYSLAILLAEHQAVVPQNFQLQIFATDIDSQAIATARAGIYPASIATDVSPERLERFFTFEPDNGIFRIKKTIRDMVVFSEHNVIKDPPFSKLDLISCRNLLIYMNAELQSKIIQLFHFALNPGGFLFQGTSENAGLLDFFAVLERKQKLYQRKIDPSGAQHADFGRFPSSMMANHVALPQVAERTSAAKKPSVREMTEQALLREVVQAGALINAQGDILYLHGRMGMYLEQPPGEVKHPNILQMAREGLRHDLTITLHKVLQTRASVRRPGLRIKTNGDFITVNLIVRPMAAAPAAWSEPPLCLVILENVQEPEHCDPATVPTGQDGKPRSKSDSMDADARIAALKEDLRAKEEYLQAANEELETSNEELKSFSEEMQSVNEELQSTNEEMETSKEELQSINEELTTINAELQSKMAELSRANNDMNNLLAGTGIATIFVDLQLRILRFTPTATRIINLILSDVGRPLAHILSNLSGYDALIYDTQAVLDTLAPKEVEVRTKEDRWYALRIQPYRTLNNAIEGAVLTFVDITATRQLRETMLVNEERLRVALSASSMTLSNQDMDLRYTWMYPLALGYSSEQIIGKTDVDLLPEQEAAELTTLKQRVMNSGKGLRQTIRSTIAGKTFEQDLTIEPLRDSSGSMVGITCASVDVTGQHTREETDPGAKEALPPDKTEATYDTGIAAPETPRICDKRP